MIRIGQKLYQERIKKGLTIDDVAKATKIRASFLSAIEKGDYKKLPSSAYALGFVKNYCAFLGFSEKESTALFKREFDEKKVFDVLPRGLSREEDFSTNKFQIKTGLILGILLFFGLLIYIGIQYRYAFINPTLNIDSPKDKQVFNSSDVLVSGKTDPNATVYVNDVPLSVDENGIFKKTISLFAGKETVKIRSVNRFGRESADTLSIEIKSGP